MADGEAEAGQQVEDIWGHQALGTRHPSPPSRSVPHYRNSVLSTSHTMVILAKKKKKELMLRMWMSDIQRRMQQLSLLK